MEGVSMNSSIHLRKVVGVGVTIVAVLGILVLVQMCRKGFDTQLLINYVSLLLTAFYVFLTFFLVRSAHNAIRTQVDLHEATHRPEIICDFPIIHTVTYLRIRNYGTATAYNITFVVSGADELAKMSGIKHGVSLLTPSSELLYFYKGPCDKEMPRTIDIATTYSNSEGRTFNTNLHHDFGYLGLFGDGEKEQGVDISHEENSPIVRRLKDIADKLGERR